MAHRIINTIFYEDKPGYKQVPRAGYFFIFKSVAVL